MVLAVFGTQFIFPAFLGCLLVYLTATFAFSFYLKRVPLLDALVLSCLCASWRAVRLLLLWLSRFWLLASRGQLNEDPVVFAFTDKMSLLLGAQVTLVVLFAL